MKFQTILADPPWEYNDRRLVRQDGSQARFGFGCVNHYKTMKTTSICNLDIQRVTAEQCHLYLWATMPLLPDALTVMQAWGFDYATVAFCWVKCNSKRFDDAILDVLQPTMIDNGRTVENFLDALTFFGPGFYTGSNIELVLLGTMNGQPFHHAEGRKASQIVYAPLSEHSAKPEAVQDRIEWMYPHATPRLELFARRLRPGWLCVGNESPDTRGEDIRDSIERIGQ